jgi:hypothetical protein
MSDSITCPNCKTEIPLTEAITHQAEERLRSTFERDRQALIAKQARQLADKDAEREAALAKVRAEAATTAAVRATEQVSVQIRDLEGRAEEQERLRRESEARELELRAQKRQLESEQERLRLENERKLDEERTVIAAAVREQADEHWKLQLRERDLKIEQIQKRADELQAAADQKRPGLQGEVLEREIEDVLREAFPADIIEPVKSGKRGADVVHHVCSARGDCGTLLWESKNHKHWSDGWIEKLRTDQQAEKADLAIIVTAALPNGITHIGTIRGIWVCDFATAVPLAIALRQQLEAIKQARIITANQSRVADDLYDYICGQEFQHYITNVVVSALTMKRELDSERTSAERMFKKREKQIEVQIRNLAGLYGGLQGIAGGALQSVVALEAPLDDDDAPEILTLAS